MFLVELCIAFQFLLPEIILEESIEWELGKEGKRLGGERLRNELQK